MRRADWRVSSWVCLLLLVCTEIARAAGNAPAVAISGEVVDANGSPLEAFTLTVYGRGRKPEVHAFDGTSGRLEVNLGTGGMGIALDAPGHATWFDVVAFNSSGNHDIGTVRLGRERVVGGRVKDARTGLPVPGVGIRYAASLAQTLNMPAGDDYPVGWWVTTDANGEFALRRLPRGRVHLEVSAAGHMTHLVELPADRNQLDIALGGGATLKGSLLFGDGTPADGTVMLRPQSDNHWVDRNGWRALERHVDAEGRFQFEGLAAGSYYLSARSAAGIVASRDLALAKDEVASVELLAEPLGRLSGWISGLAESEWASLFIRDEWDSRLGPNPARFGNGRFVVNGIPDGELVVQATANVQRHSRSITRKVMMVGREATIDFDFSGRSRIAGRVLAGTRPVHAIMVRAVPKDPRMLSAVDMSDIDGRYEIPGLDIGEYEFRVQLGLRGTHRSFDVDVVSDAIVDIHLGPFALSGAVTLGADQSFRLGNWVVQARLVSASGEPVIFRGFTDSRGVYRFDGLEKGTYRVSFASPYIGGVRNVVVDASSVQNVDIQPTISEVREVRVVDANSKEALNDVSCVVQDGVWADSPVYDLGDGLPTTLIYAGLTCSRRGYETVQIRWDGEPLEIDLAPRPP
ncbi:MAG: carboxypeptidase regulatory-like domain-containing protein [Gammaproteobacteria bacterium]|nr:carboxypeptidase regulatory-like domain-containing protein [Gammaproteobacteria bacterium]